MPRAERRTPLRYFIGATCQAGLCIPADLSEDEVSMYIDVYTLLAARYGPIRKYGGPIPAGASRAYAALSAVYRELERRYGPARKAGRRRLYSAIAYSAVARLMPVDETDLLALPVRPKARTLRVEGLPYFLEKVRGILVRRPAPSSRSWRGQTLSGSGSGS